MKDYDVIKFSIWDLLLAVWFFLDEYRRKFLIWTSILFVSFFYTLVPPLIIGKIIDFFTNHKQGQSLELFYIFVAILGCSYAAASLIRLTSKNKIGDLQAEIHYNARVKGFERLLDFSLSWHDKENTGNKVQRIQNGTVALRGLTRMMGQTGYKTIAVIVGVGAVFLFLQPIFVIFLVIYFIAFFSIHFHFYHKQQAIISESYQVQEKASGTYYEGLTNVLTIKTLGVKDTFKKNIFATEQLTKELNYQTRKVGITKWKAFQLCNAIAISVFLLLLGNGVVNGAISIGEIFVFYAYLMRLIDAASDSTDVIDDVIDYKSAIARMMPIYWEAVPIHEGKEKFPKHWNTISITNGYFSYNKEVSNEDEFALENINVVIKKNEKIGIVGHSGGGKSTFAKLLLGLYDLKKGSFTIDEKDYYSLKHSEITRNISTVLQESEMFNLSLKENITLLRNVSPEVLQKAISIAQLDELIAKLPEGLETLIGEKGYRVSGGERQRIGIARAICKDPQVLVLDEATSALDSQTEEKIQTALEKELQQKTLVIIAHRISTLRTVDRILFFEKGRIVEEGTYRELLADPHSKFSEVYKKQNS